MYNLNNFSSLLNKLSFNNSPSITNNQNCINHLPLEILAHIFSFLNSQKEQQCHLAVCHTWLDLTLAMNDTYISLTGLIETARFLSSASSEEEYSQPLSLLGSYTINMDQDSTKLTDLMTNQPLKNINPINLKKLKSSYQKMRHTFLLAVEHLNREELQTLSNSLEEKTLFNPLSYFLNFYDKAARGFKVEPGDDEALMKDSFMLDIHTQQLVKKLAEQGFLKKSLEFNEKLMKNKFTREFSQEDICKALADQGKFDEAIQLMNGIDNRYLKENALAQIGRAYRIRGDYDKAKEIAQRISNDTGPMPIFRNSRLRIIFGPTLLERIQDSVVHIFNKICIQPILTIYHFSRKMGLALKNLVIRVAQAIKTKLS